MSSVVTIVTNPSPPSPVLFTALPSGQSVNHAYSVYSSCITRCIRRNHTSTTLHHTTPYTVLSNTPSPTADHLNQLLSTSDLPFHRPWIAVPSIHLSPIVHNYSSRSLDCYRRSPTAASQDCNPSEGQIDLQGEQSSSRFDTVEIEATLSSSAILQNVFAGNDYTLPRASPSLVWFLLDTRSQSRP